MSSFENAGPLAFISYHFQTLYKSAVCVDGERERKREVRDLIKNKNKNNNKAKQMTFRQHSQLPNENPHLRHHLAPGGI